jgi:TolB-like protein
LNVSPPPRPGLFAELRRRRVLRTLALYIVGAWVLMQVADVVFPALDIPEQAIRYLLLAAVVGFPVALVFGWFFDITPQGIQRTGRASESETQATAALRLPDYLLLAALAAVLAAIIYGTVGTVVDLPGQGAESEPTRITAQPSSEPMVGVLPFSYRGTGEDAAFFASGVHDDLLTQLSQLSGLRVVSRTSVLAYADTTKNVIEIGQELGADAILEGGVQLAGEQIRINAQLIDARTDAHLWAQTYDRKLTPENIFSVQSDIARAISAALEATLTPEESRALDVIPTRNMAAYRAFHEAMQTRYGMNRERTFNEVLALFEDAVALDPGFTRAMAELVGMLALNNFGDDKSPEEIQRAEDLVQRVGELAPDSVDHLVAQTFYLYYIIRDYDNADRLLTLARERAPSDTRLLELQSWIKKRQGDFDGWVEATRQARALEPTNVRWSGSLVARLMLVHRYEEAREVAQTIDDPHPLVQAFAITLSLRQHRDLRRFRQEMEALLYERQLQGSRLEGNLWEAQLAVRDYAAAQATTLRLEQAYTPAPEPVGYIPDHMALRLLTQLVTSDTQGLAVTVAEAEQALGLTGNARDERWDSMNTRDRVLLAIARDDAQLIQAELVALQQRIADDIASEVGERRELCAFLALTGDAEATVRCLRAGLTRPSRVMHFLEPLLPYYDRVRESPEFQVLLAELVQEGWIPSL